MKTKGDNIQSKIEKLTYGCILRENKTTRTRNWLQNILDQIETVEKKDLRNKTLQKTDKFLLIKEVKFIFTFTSFPEYIFKYMYTFT